MQHCDPRTEAGRLVSYLKYVGVSLCLWGRGVDQYAKEITFVQLDCVCAAIIACFNVVWCTRVWYSAHEGDGGTSAKLVFQTEIMFSGSSYAIACAVFAIMELCYCTWIQSWYALMFHMLETSPPAKTIFLNGLLFHICQLHQTLFDFTLFIDALWPAKEEEEEGAPGAPDAKKYYRSDEYRGKKNCSEVLTSALHAAYGGWWIPLTGQPPDTAQRDENCVTHRERGRGGRHRYKCRWIHTLQNISAPRICWSHLCVPWSLQETAS